jgi:hypothetical protein
MSAASHNGLVSTTPRNRLIKAKNGPSVSGGSGIAFAAVNQSLVPSLLIRRVLIDIADSFLPFYLALLPFA